MGAFLRKEAGSGALRPSRTHAKKQGVCQGYRYDDDIGEG